jgi:hypothetical protein
LTKQTVTKTETRCPNKVLCAFRTFYLAEADLHNILNFFDKRREDKFYWLNITEFFLRKLKINSARNYLRISKILCHLNLHYLSRQFLNFFAYYFTSTHSTCIVHRTFYYGLAKSSLRQMFGS